VLPVTEPGINAFSGTCDIVDTAGAGAGDARDDISIGDNEDKAELGCLVCGEAEEEFTLGISRERDCGFISETSGVWLVEV